MRERGYESGTSKGPRLKMNDNKCLGIFGWMFGHKYIKSTFEYTYTRDYCWRCGKRVQE